MIAKNSLLMSLLLLIAAPVYAEDDFIATRDQFTEYARDKNIILIASPGRSGSTMLTDAITKCKGKSKVLKTHLLPPDTSFQGKILFIFSNPDQAAESALYRVLHSRSNGKTHFSHVESADGLWFKALGENGHNQTETNNLLTYDALGCAIQLEEWLHNRARICDLQDAQILAIKYEHLWDPETVQAIKAFLKLKTFELPQKKSRGYTTDDLTANELAFRKKHNLGTNEEPLYRAYDKARELWLGAPSYQFLMLLP